MTVDAANDLVRPAARGENAGAEGAGARPSAGDGRLPPGATLKFFWGPMDCGKSTLALQMDHNHARQGRHGLILTRNDRALRPSVTPPTPPSPPATTVRSPGR